MFKRLTIQRDRLVSQYLKGGVLNYPTESCYGLGCKPSDPNGLKRILRIKGRPQHKGMIVIAHEMAQLKGLIEPLSDEDVRILKQFWPGPFTFLLPASKKVLPLLRGKHRTLAVRITNHPVAASICKQVGALVSTSANKAGCPSIKSARNGRKVFGQKVLTIADRIGKYSQPSTIIDFSSGKVLRGQLTKDQQNLIKNRVL